ncbi:MAG: flagellar filament capping protein FliD [Lachnospiraceae bacterium]|nr:flagellar filament capping protein FliD [Lachnospiraceae bacterium]
MGSPIRITGMNSGLDTESIIKALTQRQQDKVTSLENDQKRFSWKQDKWKELNKKVTDLYNGTLASMRFTDAFTKKTTTASRPSAVTVVTGAKAMNTTQKMKVKSMASNAYLTGSTISKKAGLDGKVTASTKLSDLAGANFSAHTDTVERSAATYQAKVDAESGEQLFLKVDDTGNPVRTDGNLTYVTQSQMEEAINAAKEADPEADISNQFLKVYQKINVTDDAENPYEEGFTPGYEDIADEAELLNTLKGINDGTISLDDEKTAYHQKQTVQDTQKFNVTFGTSEPQTIEISGDMTINDLVTKLKGLSQDGAGLDVNFDENQQRFYIASNKSGSEASFSLSAYEEDGVAQNTGLLSTFGLDTNAAGFKGKYEAGSDALIELNGIEYTSDKNNFEINGLTITVNETTKNANGDYDEITLTTKQDNSGTYDLVKKFVKEYSELINEMDKLYHADNAKSYKMLSKDEKEAMEDEEVEEWEKKIKDGLLSRDRTLGDVSSAMKEVMSGVYTVKNGKGEDVNATLSTFGINTLSYFEAKENEKYALYIDGDKDSENYNVKAAEDKLNQLITNDPDLVTNFFTTLSKTLYRKLSDLMSVSQFSSSYTLYEDKMMNKQYSSYNDKIADANEKLGAAEDKYYKKFGKMESTMGKLNSTQSALSGYFGG